MTDAIRRRLLAAHRDTLAAVCEAGADVADPWPESGTDDPAAVAAPLRELLAERSLTGPLVAVLETAVEASGRGLEASPVPAPPYLVVTSRGPVCRGTLADGSRLVLLIEVFGVERRPRRYRFLDPSPESCLTVDLR